MEAEKCFSGLSTTRIITFCYNLPRVYNSDPCKNADTLRNSSNSSWKLTLVEYLPWVRHCAIHFLCILHLKFLRRFHRIVLSSYIIEEDNRYNLADAWSKSRPAWLITSSATSYSTFRNMCGPQRINSLTARIISMKIKLTTIKCWLCVRHCSRFLECISSLIYQFCVK